MVDTFLILSPGSFTTVQDAGRFGYRQLGIPVSGALDPFAYRVGNLLVGNPPDSAVLEATLVGPQIAVLRKAHIALTGADMGAKLNHRPIENWQTIHVLPGDVLSLQQLKSGCRSYLAVSGGIEVPKVMGSRSTYWGGKIGGVEGRPLKKGDIIATGEILAGGGAQLSGKPRRLAPKRIPRYPDQISLRAIAGPQDDFFDADGDTLFRSEFRVTPRADRMGYRLEGAPVRPKAGMPASIISEPAVPGGIQVPADGRPIILLVEQTVGGYAKIATVISTDLARIAQAVPGDLIHFERVSLENAHRIHADAETKMRSIAAGLAAP